MKFTFAIVASLFASTLAASVPNTAKSIAAVMQDVSKLSKQITIIDKLVGGFPANGADGAAAIHDHAATLRTVLGDFTTKLNNLPRPVSKAHASEIINGVQSFSPTIIHSMDSLSTLRPSFAALSTPSVDAVSAIKTDLSLTDDVCAEMDVALQSITPSDMTTITQNLVSPLNVAVQNAITAFS